MDVRIAVPAEIDPAAFRNFDAAAPLIDLAGETMGTVWRVRYAGVGHISAAAAEARIVECLDRLVLEMSHWREDSILCRFNRAAPGAWTALPPDFATVIASALDIAQATDGAFDPAIGALVNIYGFGPVQIAAPPDEADIAEARARSGWQRLAYDAAARRLRQPGGVALDLSGIAKGYAVDAVSALLAAEGIHHSLAEIGGELVGRGIRPDGDPWWVDLEAAPESGCAPIRVALHGLAVATSGNYVRGAHSIDPRTGLPAANGIDCVNVLHQSAMLADAWATALTILGVEAGMTIATERGIAARFVQRTDDGFRELMTPALIAML